METLTAWLLLILAGLAIACQVFYLKMRRAESVRKALESLHDEERKTNEATLAALLSDAPKAESSADWRSQAVLLSRHGLTPNDIGYRLGVPAGEVELVLKLAQTAESTNRGRE